MSKKKRTFSKEEKLKILGESKQHGVNITLEKYGVYPATYYSWRKKYDQMGEEGFVHGITPAQLKEIKRLEKENAFLRKLLIPKNSQNSSKPPSTDIVTPKRMSSLRKSTGKKPAGQLGHKGNNLKIVTCPDVIEKRTVDFCNVCGTDQGDTPEVFVAKRQLIDLAPIKLITTEQQVYKRTCSCVSS